MVTYLFRLGKTGNFSCRRPAILIVVDQRVTTQCEMALQDGPRMLPRPNIGTLHRKDTVLLFLLSMSSS